MAKRKQRGPKLVDSGVYGSTEAAQEAMSKGGAQGLIWSIGDKAPRTVRFLTGSEGWCGYWEVWLPAAETYSPLTEGMEIPDDSRKTYRVLTNVLMRRDDGDRVVPLKLPKDLANRLMNRQERTKTITDRDFILSREGKQLDTTYDYDVEAKEKEDLDAYELLDLEEVLLTEAQSAQALVEEAESHYEDEDEDYDDPDEDEEDYEEDYEDPDEDEGEEWTRAEVQGMTVGELRALAKDLDIRVPAKAKKAVLVKKVWAELADA